MKPEETPNETPNETPDETPSETPDETPDEAPDETPSETPDETPSETPDETPDEGTTEEKPDESKPEDEKDDNKKEETKKYSEAVENKDKLYSSINSLMQEWIRDTARKDGDITAIKSTGTEKDKDGKDVEVIKGYYIVLYKSVNDNKYALANVRHILVKFEGGTTNSQTGQTTYSDAEKAKAKEKATKIYDEWLKGAKTEDSFAELAKKYTNDSNGEQGGLYEDVYPGQMVTTFNDFCFADGRKAGDHDIIETEYGWHVMFYSGDSKTNYRDYMVTKDKLTVDMEAWQKSLVDAISLTEKNTKFVNKDYIIQPANNLGM